MDGCEEERRGKYSKNNDEMKLFSLGESSAFSGPQSFWIPVLFPVLMCNCSCLLNTCSSRYINLATVVK